MKKILLPATLLLTCLSPAVSQITLTLQPGPADGIDAEIFSCVPCGYNTRNFGKIAWFDAIAWTKDGKISNARSLLKFDLSAIPQGAQIISARLSLFFALDLADEFQHFHTPCNGTNASVLLRIIKPWEEEKVTWKNQPKTTTLHMAVLHGSTSPTQDYTNIDVRKLVQDMVNQPNRSYGFMLKLKKEKKYKKLLFGSSDHRNPALRPRLQITYSSSHTNSNFEYGGDLPGSNERNALIYGFRLVPNPAFRESIEMVFFSHSSVDAQISVVDIMGHAVYNKTIHIEEGENVIWLEEAALWQRGIYILQIRANGESFTRKFVIL